MERLTPLAMLACTPALLGATLTVAEAELPTTLHPVFARTAVDDRAQELIFDRVFYRDPIG